MHRIEKKFWASTSEHGFHILWTKKHGNKKKIDSAICFSFSLFNQQMQIILGEIVGCEIEYLLIGKFLLLSFI
jgi:hypothetical protein